MDVAQHMCFARGAVFRAQPKRRPASLERAAPPERCCHGSEPAGRRRPQRRATASGRRVREAAVTASGRRLVEADTRQDNSGSWLISHTFTASSPAPFFPRRGAATGVERAALAARRLLAGPLAAPVAPRLFCAVFGFLPTRARENPDGICGQFPSDSSAANVEELMHHAAATCVADVRREPQRPGAG